MERVESSSRGLSEGVRNESNGECWGNFVGTLFFLSADRLNDELCTVLLFNWRRTR